MRPFDTIMQQFSVLVFVTHNWTQNKTCTQNKLTPVSFVRINTSWFMQAKQNKILLQKCSHTFIESFDLWYIFEATMAASLVWQQYTWAHVSCHYIAVSHFSHYYKDYSKY